MALETYQFTLQRGKTYYWNGQRMSEFILRPHREDATIVGTHRFYKNETTQQLANAFSFYPSGRHRLFENQTGFGYVATDVWHNDLTSMLHRARRWRREEDSYSREILNNLVHTNEFAERLFPVLSDAYVEEASALQV